MEKSRKIDEKAVGNDGEVRIVFGKV